MIRRSRRPRDPRLEVERRRLDEIERRARRAVDAVTEHGRRNGFADRWRRTLPPTKD